jgi:hypothetical protein
MLHTNCKTRLTQLALEAVGAAKVEHGMFLTSEGADIFKAADQALPTKTPAHSFISDHPFSDFAVSSLRDRLRVSPGYDADADVVPLTSLAGFEDAERVALELVNSFDSLPWQYTFIYPLPLKATYLEGAPEEEKEYELAEGLRLVRPGPSFASTYAVEPEGVTLADVMTARLTRDKPSSWSTDTLHLVHTVSGYLTESFPTQLAKDARLLLRTIGGLLEGSGLAQYHYEPVSFWLASGARDKWIYAYQQQESSWHSAASTMLEGDYAERLNSLRWLEVPEVQERDWEAWLRFVGLRLRPTFAKTDGAARLRRCSQWHFDSQCGSNRLLQFVQATVAVEILLGDKAISDRVGIGAGPKRSGAGGPPKAL